MRAFVPAIFLLLTLFSLHCKSSKPSASGPAGMVLALEGQASAISSLHGERQLAIGDPVFRDDRIATRADTAIEIRLEHNGALWSLRGAREVVVGESPAWRAERSSAAVLSTRIEDTTGAAGRNTEREAAEHSSDLANSAATDETSGDSEPDPEPVEGSAQGGESVDDSKDTGSTADGAKVPKKGSAGWGGKPSKLDARDGVGTGDLDSLVKIGSNSGYGNGSALGPELPKRPGFRLQTSIVSGPLSRKHVDRLLRARGPSIAGCAWKTPLRGRLLFAITISAQGRIARDGIELTGHAELVNEIGRCVKSALASMQAPAQGEETRVKARVELSDR